MSQTFRLPDVGEGLTEAEIVQWLVSPGDTVTVNQPLCEIETAKALVELPSPYAGKVEALHGAAGHVLAVGAPLISIDTGTSPPPAPVDESPRDEAAPADTGLGPAEPDSSEQEPAGQVLVEPEPVETAPAADDEAATDSAPRSESAGTGVESTGRRSVLVGYGPAPGAQVGRRHRRPAPNPQGTEVEEAGPPGAPVKPVRHGGLEVARSAEARLAQGAPPALAKPPVRRLAKELGVDLDSVDPTGPEGTITRADVHRVAQALTPEPGDTGVEDRVVPVRGVMRSMAAAMVESAFTAPHATLWRDVDVTESVHLLARLRASRSDVRWTATALGLAALQRAAAEFPGINATFEDDVIIEHGEIRLAMAVASPRGLLVANVAGGSIRTIAQSVSDVGERARSGKLAPEEMSGSTITLTNVGALSVDGGTPIMPPGHVAILSLGRFTERPWVIDGEVMVRSVATLALSFDHRCIDGALGARALASVAGFLSDPAVALSV